MSTMFVELDVLGASDMKSISYLRCCRTKCNLILVHYTPSLKTYVYFFSLKCVKDLW